MLPLILSIKSARQSLLVESDTRTADRSRTMLVSMTCNLPKSASYPRFLS
jgi:hypothetical protein